VKRFLALLAVAAVAGVTYVAAAPGGQTVAPTARQFAALKKQVSKLSKKVKAQGATIATLQTAEKGVKTEADAVAGFIANCLTSSGAGALPINQFGDATNATFGYRYVDSGASSDIFTTALDVDGSSSPGAFLQTVDPSCVTSSALRKAGALTERRATIRAAAKH